jgi:hypothetical protein
MDSQINLDVSYSHNIISKANDTKFLGLCIDNTLSWKLHTEQVLYTLSAACYALRSVKPYMSQEIPKMLCYAYFHSALAHGIIPWGNSKDNTKFSKCRRGQLELSQEAGIETLAEIYLKI